MAAGRPPPTPCSLPSAEALRRGERIEIRGFGTFSVTETKARNGRNPRTGQPVKIPAGRRVRFKPSKTLLG